MKIDYDKINYRGFQNKGALVYQVHYFPFMIAGKKQAIIHILDFGDDYGSQAKLLNTYSNKGSVSSGKTFKTVENALNDVIKLILDELLEDPEIRDFIIEET